MSSKECPNVKPQGNNVVGNYNAINYCTKEAQRVPFSAPRSIEVKQNETTGQNKTISLAIINLKHKKAEFTVCNISDAGG